MSSTREGRARGVLLALAALMLACGGSDPVGSAAPGSIRGAVTDNTGAAMANVPVTLTGNAQSPRTTSSGTDGAFSFADVPAGAYFLQLAPPTGFTAGPDLRAVSVTAGVETTVGTLMVARDTCLVARPDFGGPATAEDLALFAYDARAPLDLKKTLISAADDVELSSITFTSPDGGLVPGILAVPTARPGLLPGIVAMHPSGFSTTPWAPYLKLLAQKGAVVIAIDAPYWRRGGTSLPRFIAADRDEQVQLMKDLQRAVDVLLAQGNVDPARIGFEGYSYGGIMGAQFVGIERRLKTAVITAAHGGQVTGATTPVNLGWLAAQTSCATRNAWFRSMTPIEPIRFIPHASPTTLFFQIARFDNAVLLDDAQALYDAAPSPKQVTYYDTGHGLNLQAQTDKQAWLQQQLGLDP